jgi:predicted Rossmann fold flavoprotein
MPINPIQPDLTVVIGGGAAGICAAITKARRGCRVVICEKTAQIGKKILASGNGRCNLLNDDLTEGHYNGSARSLVGSVFSRYGKADLLRFFEGLGLITYSQSGRIFPATNQAASVLKVLELELRRLSIPVEYGFNCSSISFSNNGITVASQEGKMIDCVNVILTGGGKSYPALGSDGSCYAIAQQLGHTVVPPVPSAVPLVVRDSLCHLLQGQRISAVVKSLISGTPGQEIKGELLFTKYGLSGTGILDVSEEVSLALNRYAETDVFISADMVPFMTSPQLRHELERRKRSGFPPSDILAGILPNKFGPAIKGVLESNNFDAVVQGLKGRQFRVYGTRGWNEAEFTAGGVAVSEVIPETLESRLHKGLYFAGEVLDVNGGRGGYNLAWAWASGLLAGRTE